MQAQPQPPRCVLWWLRSDARLHDNAALRGALTAAKRRQARVACVYLLPAEQEPTAADVWRHACLSSLDADLRRRYGTRLVCKEGGAEALASLALALGAVSVHAQATPAGSGAEEEAAVATALRASGAELCLHSGHTSVDDLAKLRLPAEHGGVGHFGTMSPFCAAHARATPTASLSEPPTAATFLGVAELPGGQQLAQHAPRMPPRDDWGERLLASWGETPGEDDALRRLDSS